MTDLTVTIPAGVTVVRDDYIPANQRSTHALVAGTYPVERHDARDRPAADGDRARWLVAVVPTTGGTHTYWSRYPRGVDTTSLGAGVVHLRVDGYAAARGFTVRTPDGYVSFPVDGLEQPDRERMNA